MTEPAGIFADYAPLTAAQEKLLEDALKALEPTEPDFVRSLRGEWVPEPGSLRRAVKVPGPIAYELVMARLATQQRACRKHPGVSPQVAEARERRDWEQAEAKKREEWRRRNAEREAAEAQRAKVAQPRMAWP